MLSSVVGLLLVIVIILLLFRVFAFIIGGPIGLILAILLIYLIVEGRN